MKELYKKTTKWSGSLSARWIVHLRLVGVVMYETVLLMACMREQPAGPDGAVELEVPGSGWIQIHQKTLVPRPQLHASSSHQHPAEVQPVATRTANPLSPSMTKQNHVFKWTPRHQSEPQPVPLALVQNSRLFVTPKSQERKPPSTRPEEPQEAIVEAAPSGTIEEPPRLLVSTLCPTCWPMVGQLFTCRAL